MRSLQLTFFCVTVSLLSFVLFQGCAPIYVPNATHVHLLDEKGDISGAIYTGTNGLDIQAAYAVKNNISILGAGSFGNSYISSEDSYQSHRYFEGGAGYFEPFNKSGRYELIAGIGFGSAEASIKYFGPDSTEVTSKGNYSRIFIQANSAMKKKHLEIGMALRLALVSFSKLETSSTVYNGSKTSVFIEPMLYMNVGWERVKVVTQLGLIEPLGDGMSFGYEPLFLTVGLKANLK